MILVVFAGLKNNGSAWYYEKHNANICTNTCHKISIKYL